MIRILQLVLCSNDDKYIRMKGITEKYYRLFPNIDTYYYMYDDTLEGMHGNTLYIRGVESFIPGILDKTIKAFEYFLPKLDEYDYIIRSNVSTLINITLLCDYLKHTEVIYGGGNTIQLEVNKGVGIYEDEYKDLIFVQGTAIVFNRDMLKLLLKNKSLLKYSVIDDVAIRLLIDEIYPEIIPKYMKHFIFCHHYDMYQVMEEKAKDTIFYRNNTAEDREKDVNVLEYITKYLTMLNMRASFSYPRISATLKGCDPM